MLERLSGHKYYGEVINGLANGHGYVVHEEGTIMFG